MKKRVFGSAILLAAALLVAGGVMAGSIAKADVESGSNQSIIQRLVERFGLNQNDVEEVFAEEHQARQEEMQERMSERLDEAVSAGNLTEEQKQLILQKQEELRSERQAGIEEMRDLSLGERRELMEEHRTELESWADENGIELQYLVGPHRGGSHHGFGPRLGQ